MPAYTLPREVFNLLVEVFGEKQKAETFAKAFESAIVDIQEKAREEIIEKKDFLKVELKEDLKKELVTREIFEERFKVIEERFKVIEEKFNSLNFKLNIFIAIALLALTLANPTFVKLVEGVFR